MITNYALSLIKGIGLAKCIDGITPSAMSWFYNNVTPHIGFVN